MLVQTKGIVFRQTKFSETSVIALIYTEKFGLLSYIVQGIRRQGSKQKAALLQPGSYLDLVVYHRPEKKLNRIKEMKAAIVYQFIPFNVVRGMLLLFMIEVCTHSIKEEEINHDLFTFLEEAVIKLESASTSMKYFPQQFLLYLSQHLGIQPNLSQGVYFDLVEGSFTDSRPIHNNYVDGDGVEIIRKIIKNNKWINLTIEISKKDRTNLTKALLAYYNYHLTNFGQLKSIDILEQVLN